jgi:hypothetical protein
MLQLEANYWKFEKGEGDFVKVQKASLAGLHKNNILCTAFNFDKGIELQKRD